MKRQLGKLIPVDLRDQWENEASEFTPWLAQSENLSLLGETLGLDLELVGVEQSVGDFRVDILAIDTVSNRHVIIENQLEKTNHAHLGQLLTYASGYDALAVVWIAKHVCQEHRQALDWLNEKTTEDLGFFGIEMELWRIGDSAAAPKFSIISQPNEWTKAVRPQSTERVEPTEMKLLQHEFWQSMIEYFKSNHTHLNLRKPRPQHWYDIGIGKSKVHISLTVNSKEKRLSCGIYIGGLKAKTAFASLLAQKGDIESELNATLDWRELPNRQASRILQLIDGDIEDRGSWQELFFWLKERSEAFHRVFSKRASTLDLGPED
jgi:hypothetical protein